MRSNPLRKSSLWAFPPTLSAVSPLCDGGGQNGFSVRRKATFVWVFGSSFERRSRAADRWWNSWILLRVDDLFGSDRIQPPTGGQMQTDRDMTDFFPPTFCGVCVYMCVCVGVERSSVFSGLYFCWYCPWLWILRLTKNLNFIQKLHKHSCLPM